MFFDSFVFDKKHMCREPDVYQIPLHDKVERLGYVPFAKRVQNMEQAGLNLLAIRAEMCDFKPDDAIDWSKDFENLNGFDKFQQEEMMKQVAEKYAKYQAIMEKNKMIQALTEQGYTVTQATDQVERSGTKEEAKETVNTTVQSE